MQGARTRRTPSRTTHSDGVGATKGRASGQISRMGLALIGVGGIIGAGFFLGCGLPISLAGPGVLLAFVVGALITAQVTGALTSIAVNHPVHGSFQVFAQMYVSSFAGYIQGWTFYLTCILTVASEAVAMAVFTKLWLPNAPVALLASVYSVLVILINAFGAKNFERVEALMSIVKIAALIGFIGVSIFIVAAHPALSLNHPTFGDPSSWFPKGLGGVLRSMLIVLFTFAGIGVFATAAPLVKHPRDIDGAAMLTIVSLTVLYLASIGCLLWVVQWSKFSTSESPFVVVLKQLGNPWVGNVFNGVIMVAAFSVMAGSLYAANEILRSLGHSHYAPGFVARASHRGIPYGALIVSTLAIGVCLAVSVAMPANVYNVLISASSYFTLLNWGLILWTFIRWKRRTDEEQIFTSKLCFGEPVSIWITMALIVALGVYSLTQREQLFGFIGSAVLCGLVSIGYLFRGAHKT